MNNINYCKTSKLRKCNEIKGNKKEIEQKYKRNLSYNVNGGAFYGKTGSIHDSESG